MDWDEYSFSGSVTAGIMFVLAEKIVEDPSILQRLLFSLGGYLFWIVYGLIIEKIKLRFSN